MKLYYFSEMPHHEYPDEEGDKYPSLRLEFPNRFFDREKAAANYQRYLTEYEFADQAGFSGLMTVAVSGARHILEDVGDVPFANISNLNGVDTASNTGVIAGLSGTEAAIARRWRYALAGPGNGFTFTSAETTAWGTMQPFGGRAVVTVANTSATLRTVTVVVTVPGLPGNVTLSTVIVRMF